MNNIKPTSSVIIYLEEYLRAVNTVIKLKELPLNFRDLHYDALNNEKDQFLFRAHGLLSSFIQEVRQMDEPRIQELSIFLSNYDESQHANK